MNCRDGCCSLPAGPSARERSQSCLTCCSQNSLSLRGRGKGLDKFIGEKSIKRAFFKKNKPCVTDRWTQAGKYLHTLTLSLCFSISIHASSRSPGLTSGTKAETSLLLAARASQTSFPKPTCWQCPPAVFPTKPTYGSTQVDTGPQHCLPPLLSLCPSWDMHMPATGLPPSPVEPEVHVLHLEVVTFFVSFLFWMNEREL